ncbi:MAG: protein kinase [Planctomycetia bacterium]|nr:protein kinase [Planctomycetia bacterium]
MTSEHPVAQTLADFGNGLLNGDAHALVEEHLCHCEKCQAYVADLPDDRFTQLFRSLPVASNSKSVKQQSGYEILDELGQGGMGVVYRARDRKLNRLVALKKIKNGSLANYSEQKRFLREAEIVAKLVHPGIVQIYEVGESATEEGLPVPYFAMELVEGESLAQLLERGPLSEPVAADLIETIARAIHEAHVLGILHRDLKPANILLSAQYSVLGAQQKVLSTLVPKIADFGLAKLLQGQEAQTMSAAGAMMGTPGYMAPEQIRGDVERMSAPTDVFALGAILYECLTGKAPYAKDSNWISLEAVLKYDPTPLRQLTPGISKELEAICLKCLQQEPDKRYGSALDLAEDLKRYRQHQPILARHATPLERSVKWMRRHPWPTALLCLLTVMIAAVITGLIVHNVELQKAITRVETEKSRADANYRKARQTIQQMLSRINGMPSSQLEGARQLQSKQLDEALAFYESILADADDDKPEVQFDTAVTLTSAGTLQSILGRNDQAEASLTRAISLLEKLEWNQTELGGMRMAAWNKLGSAQMSQGKAKQAAESYSHSQKLARQLIEGNPEQLALQHDLAWSHHNLGVALLQLGQQREAGMQFEQAVLLRQALRTRNANNPEIQSQLAESLVNLALVEQLSTKLVPAHRHLNEAETLLKHLVNTVPETLEFQVSLASLLLNKGNMQGSQGFVDFALTSYQAGLKLIEQVLKQESGYADAKRMQISLNGSIANLYDQTRRPILAVPYWDEVVSRSAPHNRQYRFMRLNSLTRASQWSQANKEISSLAELELTNDELVYLFRLVAVIYQHDKRPDEVTQQMNTNIKAICAKLYKQADGQLKKSLSQDPVLSILWNANQ